MIVLALKVGEDLATFLNRPRFEGDSCISQSWAIDVLSWSILFWEWNSCMLAENPDVTVHTISLDLGA